MKIYLCLFIPTKTPLQNVYSIDEIFMDEESANEWLNKAQHHEIADLRFWFPKILEWELKGEKG